MGHVLIIILDDIKAMPEILQAWQKIGVPGATILRSAGAYRVSNWLEQAGLNAIYRLFETREVQRKTLLVALDDEDLLAQAIAEAERVVGGFENPNTGILLVLPIVEVRGIYKKRAQQESLEVLPSALRSGWNDLRSIKISKVNQSLRLEPIIVHLNDTLDDVAQQMLAHLGVTVACVVSDEGMLKGLLPLDILTDDLFYHILPEEFLREITDIEKMMSFADKAKVRTAADAMVEAQWVKNEDTLKDAFIKMHEHELSGIPIVDDEYKVAGYINQLELLAVCMNNDKETLNNKDQQ